MFNVFGVQNLVPGEGVQTAGGGDNDVWAFAFVAENFGVFGHWGATIECANSNVGHVFGESGVFVFDLEGKFASVAEDENSNLAVYRLKLLKCGQDENRSFAMTRLCLTQDIHS